MHELMIFKNPMFGQIRTIEENGAVLFCGSDIAKALGYSNPTKAVNDHCKGVCERRTNDSLGRQQNMKYIPEGDIYRLAAKSELPGADAFERWIFDEVLPSIRKNGMYSMKQLSPQLQLLINIETKQRAQEQAIAATNKRLDSIGEIVALNPSAWRDETKRLIAQVAVKMGGMDYIRDVQAEIHKLVNQRGGVSLETRLTNKRRRMADEGACKSARDKVTKVDIIAEDKKLIEIYIAIVKEMAVKYGVAGQA